MKSLFALALIVFASASAQAATTDELIELLVQNKSEIVVELDSMPELGMTIDAVLKFIREPGAGTVNEVKSACEADPDFKGLIGARNEICFIMVLNSDIAEPKTESSLGVFMKVSTPVVPNAKPKLSNKKITVYAAG